MPTGISKRFVAKNGLDNNNNTITNVVNPSGNQDAATKSYVDTSVGNIIPSQTGNTGKYLTTNGEVVSWSELSGTGTVTSVAVSGGTTGLTSTGGPITSSGTITLAGTLAIANGGTGQTTASAAFTALAPSQANNAGKFLTTDGTGASWTTIESSAITSALGYTPVNRAGDTMTGTLTLAGNPTQGLQAATKDYVDNVASGLNIHAASVAATTAALTATYNNGSGGVGATLIGTGVLPTIGGVSSLSVNDRVLVKNQTNAVENGIYTVTQTTDPWTLTRAGDFDNSPSGEVVAGDMTYIQQGTLAGTQWVQTTTGPITIGTSNIVFTQFGGPNTLTAGTGIDITSNVISNTGVTSITAGSNISVSASTGAITVGFTGTLPIANGGTGATDAGTARSNLSAAKSGANSDITGLSGLTTALSLSQGGTGATDAATARSNLSAAASGANSDITSITGLTTALTIAQGGTGATTANTAFTALAPAQVGQSGKYLTTDGTSASWAAFPSVQPGGSTTQLQYNNAGALAGTARLAYNGTDTLTVGTVGNTIFNIIANANGADVGSSLSIRAGSGGAGAGLKGGDLTISGGPCGSGSGGTTSMVGGDLYLQGGSGGLTSGNFPIPGGSIYLRTAVSNTGYVERLRIIPAGAWGLGGANYGTSGQVLTSQGSGSPPIWQTISLSASNLTGTVALANGGTGLTAVPGSSGQLIFNSSSAYSATGRMSYNGTDTLTVGSGDTTFNIRGAIAPNNTSNGASVLIQAGQGATSYASQGVVSGNLTLAGGDANSGGFGGNITIRTGVSSAGSGTLFLSTGAGTTAERLRIIPAGAWGLGGANYGTSGQVLTSNGSSAAPTWTTISSASGTVTSVAVSGGTTGLTTSGGPITASGTITLAGTLAVANGGTGATTASAAAANILPSQTGNSGKVLSTDGAGNLSWVSSSAGSVTSIDISGGTTGLTATGGPITSSGTITLAGTLAVANGGTGATTLTGYVKGDGTSAFTASSTIPGSDISGNISGNAANVTGTVAVANGGTGATDAGTARSNLSAAASGANSDITSLSGLTTALSIAQGGTGATSASTAATNILPSQTGNNGKVLTTDGAGSLSWVTAFINNGALDFGTFAQPAGFTLDMGTF